MTPHQGQKFMTEFEERDEFIYSEKGLAVTNGKEVFIKFDHGAIIQLINQRYTLIILKLILLT